MKQNKHLDIIHRTGALSSTCKTVGMRLHAGERTEYFPQSFWDDAVAHITQEDILFYPDDSELRLLLAEYHGVPVDSILTFAGADAALKCIFSTFMDEGSTAISPEYRFPMYDVYAKQLGGNIQDLLYDGLTLTSNIRRPVNDPRLVVLANPNSPVGDSPSLELFAELEKLGVPIVVDSVYSEFGSTGIDMSALYRNYIFVHSFSKSWGMPGIRAGYVIANDNIISKMTKMKQMCGVSGPSIKLAKFLVENSSAKDDYIKHIIGLRNEISKLFDYNIGGSWVHLPNWFAGYLDMAGITYKKNCSIPGYNNLLRVTVSQNLFNLIEVIMANPNGTTY